MSQHVSEDELATLLPDKASTTLQYCADGEKSAKVSSPDDHLSNYVSFHAVSYEVTQRRHCKKVMPKIILNNVSGIMKAGLNAIMGPTESGKTVLLDILAGHKNGKGMTGQVLINGRPQPVNFRCEAAYVVQDDFLMGGLTVRENIAFSAALRLPSKYKWKDRKYKVDEILEEVGLTEIADNKVETEFIRGISKEEKRRTSIGMELIVSSEVVFLDEPTTGLDISAAISLIRLLKDLSQQDRVIILSIRQPRYSIYKLFDTVSVLSKGYMVYHGPAGDSPLQYFNNHGYECEQRDNPADFVLEVVLLNEAQEAKCITGSSVNNIVQQNKLAVVYAESSQFHETNKELMQIREHAIMKSEKLPQFSTNVLWQFGILSVCTVKNIVRNPVMFIVETLVMAAAAIIIGLIYVQLQDDYAGFQNRVGVLFFIMIIIAFASLLPLKVFIQETPLFIYQNARGYFRVSSYVFAKSLCDVLPMRIIPVLLYSVISYWMLGLKKDLYKFSMYTLALLLTSCGAAASVFSASVGIRISAVAYILNILIFVVQVIFSGFLVNLRSIASWLRWLQYLSMLRFTLNALFENELQGGEYCDRNFNGTNWNCIENRTVVGDVYLDSLDFTKYDVWYNQMAVFTGVIINLIIAYISLRLIKKQK